MSRPNFDIASATPLSTPDVPAWAREIQQSYLIDDLDVHEALAHNPGMIPYLNEIRKKIAEYFPDSHVRLELSYDPERESIHAPEFVVSILTDSDVAKAMDTLRRFDYEWWLESSTREKSDLCVSLSPS